MSDLPHKVYGVLMITFLVVCVVGLLALGLIGLNAYSDYRHEQEVWAIEHPGPVASATNGTPAVPLGTFANCLEGLFVPVATIIVMGLVLRMAHWLTKIMMEDR